MKRYTKDGEEREEEGESERAGGREEEKGGEGGGHPPPNLNRLGVRFFLERSKSRERDSSIFFKGFH